MRLWHLPPKLKKLALQEQIKTYGFKDATYMLHEAFNFRRSPQGRYFWVEVNKGNFDVYYEQYKD